MAKALSLFEARARVLAAVQAAPVSGLVGPELVPLERAHGRTLASAIVADSAWPVTDRAAMDGFAVATGGAGLAAGATLPVVGESLAGKPWPAPLSAGSAIRIMTGAVVPAGADAVVPVEQTSGFAGATVQVAAAVRTGQHVRPAGSELRAGSQVLRAGTRLRAAEIGVLAVLGHTRVPVVVPPRVAIVATGDEVVPADRVPLPHQVRESNSWALAAQVHECGGVAERLGIAPDEAAPLRAMLQRGLVAADVLVTIGGVSKGSHDLVHGTLGELGVRTEFHGLDLKPGKPTFFGVVDAGASGERRRARYVFGLPGNPASSFTVFDLLVRPLLLALQGCAVGEWLVGGPLGGVPWSGVPWPTNARLQAMPAALRLAADRAVVDLAPGSPSGDPFGLLHGNCYALVLPEQQPGAAPLVRVVGGSSGVQLP
jgi:molybdopterin molybdotransferase